jgi:DNA invertase Pin-like site-specific DNA recombinase
MPTVYAYGRASTGRQTITEDAQRSVCEEYIKRALAPEGYTYGGWLYDSATSGTRPMFERDEGRKVWALVQPGDKIIWAKLDRAFRSVIDAAQTMQLLASKDVSFNSLDLGLDTSSPIGRCVFTILTAFAELEVAFIRQRTRDSLREKRKAGKPHGRHAPIGWRKCGKGKDSYYVPCPEERRQVDEIAALRQAGASLERLVMHTRQWRRPNGYAWNINSITRAIKAQAARYAKEFPARKERRRSVAG